MAFRCCGKYTPPADQNQAKNTDEELNKQEDEDKHPRAEDIKKLFERFDANKHGMISKYEVLSALKKMKIPVVEDEIFNMVAKYESNEDSQLTYQEFSNMMKELLRTKDFPLLDMFNYFDADEDGFVTIEEFLTAMQCIGFDVTEEQAKQMMTPLISPGAEGINFDSFLSLTKTVVLS